MRRWLRRTTFWSLWVMVFTLPWQGSVALPGLGTASRLIGVFAALVALLTLGLHGRTRRLLDVHLTMVLLVAWAVGSLLWTADATRTVGYVETAVQLLVLFVLLWEFADEVDDSTRLLGAWVLGCVVGALGVVAALGAASSEVRHGAFGFDENDLGSMLALGVPTALYLAGQVRRSWRRVALLGAAPLCALGVLLTASRGAMLVLLVGLTFVPLSARDWSPRRRAAALGAMLVVGSLVVTVVPPATQDRLQSVESEVRSGDLNARLPVWDAAMQAIDDQPLIGTGAGTSDLEIGRRSGYGLGAHNTYLSVATDLGLVGLSLFALLLLATALHTTGLPRRDRTFTRVLLATLAVAMVPLHWELQKTVYVVLALVLGICAQHTVSRPAPPGSERRPVLTGLEQEQS
jgi:O-antigen ligase